MVPKLSSRIFPPFAMSPCTPRAAKASAFTEKNTSAAVVARRAGQRGHVEQLDQLAVLVPVTRLPGATAQFKSRLRVSFSEC